ncbi:E1A-binding protein, partial [Ophiophagus hannah]
MHHGAGSQNAQRQLQRSRSFTGSESEDQQANLPQSPSPSFAPSASPSAPQSPSYQIQQFIMSRSPVTGQNVNITLQNVGPVSTASQQITLTPLPIPSPTSPSFQFSPQQRRFEHGSPSYIQVTSPLPPQVQSQSPTQPSPVSVQTLSSVRAGTPGPGLGMCSQSPTRGFVDASVLVRQISLSPSNGGGHFVYQEGSGLAQIAQSATAQVQLSSSGTSATVRERRLSQPHSQTGGTIHHLGPQSPVASGGNIQGLPNPGHITTSNLPPQISNIIQGMQQQQQQQQGQSSNRPLGFDRTSAGLIAGVGGPAFGITSPPPPTSPSRASIPQGLTGHPLGPSVCAVVKKPKKVEEIPPATPEAAQMRKQCLEHHFKQTEALKDAFKEYLIELFFLQHLQGNMMDFLAFKKKHCLPLQAYLRQNDLDLEEEEEEEQSEVINDEVGTLFIRLRDPELKWAVMGWFFSIRAWLQESLFNSSCQLHKLMGQKQSQQQYDPSKGPPVQNAASLHTPPPQLPGRLQPTNVPISSLPPTLQLAPQVAQMNDPPVQQAAIHVKAQPQNVTVTAAAAVSHGQVQAPSQPQGQPAAHGPGPMTPSQVVPSQTPTPQQITTLSRPSSDSNQNSQRISANVVPPTSSNPPTSGSNPAPQTTHSTQANRSSPGSTKSASPVASKPPGLAVAATPKNQNTTQNTAAALPQDSTHEKLAEQVKLMVRTVARYHEEKLLNAERAKKEEKTKLRRIAATIAREIEYFWSNIEQVVEIKLQIEFQEKRRKALNLKKCQTKVEDEEETIEEQEKKEGNVNHQMELSTLAKEGQIQHPSPLVRLPPRVSEDWPRLVGQVVQEEAERHLGRRSRPREDGADHRLLLTPGLQRSQYRLLLIDTPLHNTLMELWTMVHFLIPGISKAYLDFPVKAANEENQDYCHKLVIRLHR